MATMAMVTAITWAMATTTRWQATKRVMARAVRAIETAMRIASNEGGNDKGNDDGNQSGG